MIFNALTTEDLLFHSLGAATLIFAVMVVFVSNPIYSALFLALAMCLLGALYFVMEAYFLAVAQVTVYAGAVMVLFVMVLMLFDLKREIEDILKLSAAGLVKIMTAGLLCGFLIGASWLAMGGSGTSSAPATPDVSPTLLLSRTLFTKSVFAFESVGLILLVVIVGTVALAKSKGGTHHAE